MLHTCSQITVGTFDGHMHEAADQMGYCYQLTVLAFISATHHDLTCSLPVS